jgi:hypothetical protein
VLAFAVWEEVAVNTGASALGPVEQQQLLLVEEAELVLKVELVEELVLPRKEGRWRAVPIPVRTNDFNLGKRRFGLFKKMRGCGRIHWGKKSRLSSDCRWRACIL